MISTIDAPQSLTSLSQPPQERCRRLLTKGRPGANGANVILLICAIVLPAIAVSLGAHHLKYGIAFVLGIALVFVVLSWPVLGGWMLIGLVPTLSGLEPGVLVPNVRISEALIGVIGVTVLLATRRLAAVRWGMLEWLLLAYGVVWAFLGVYDDITLKQHLTLSEWGTVFGQLQFFLLYRTVRVTLRTRRERMIGLGVLFGVAVPMTLLAILQEVNVGGLRNILWSITGGTSTLQTSGIIRATSLFGNWASLAGFLLPLLLLLVALALGNQLKEHKRAALALAALLVIGMLLTAEISVIGCMVLGVFYLGSKYGRFMKMMGWIGIAAAIAICVVGPVLATRFDQQFGAVAGSNRSSLQPQTVEFRENVWTQQYLPAIARRPAAGYGVVLPSTIQWQYPESQYIAVLIEGGYPLLLMYVLLLWGMIDQARRAARSRDPVEQALGRSLIVCSVSLFALGIIWPFLSNGGFPQVVWCLFALAVPAKSRFPFSDPSPLLPAIERRRQPALSPKQGAATRPAAAPKPAATPGPAISPGPAIAPGPAISPGPANS